MSEPKQADVLEQGRDWSSFARLFSLIISDFRIKGPKRCEYLSGPFLFVQQSAKGVKGVSALAWPLCVCIAALIAVLIFRKEISRFIERTRTITKEGVTTEAPGSQEVTSAPKASSAEKLLKGFDNQLLVEQENLITNFLKEENVHGAERERVLVRFLAAAYIVNRFENTYRSIWGSQFRALEMLNVSEPQGVPHQALA
jgi:hypothetical protein